ncbi:MAG: SDR family NAD(P)-dependent oxidoreductase [bacterium]|nr:SDR family NAD(P)-dependent oxidoreductase [Myxococcota bacterium]
MSGIQDLKGKTAVVTGGGSGIGKGMCRRFAHQGMNVVVADIEGEAAEKVAIALRTEGARAIALACDVSQRSDIESLATASIDEFGAVDVACNNAGIFFGGKLREFTEGDWEWTMSVNLMGVVHGSTIFGKHMAERGSGQIVNTASIGGWAPDPNCAPYTTSKFAVVGFSEALRRDLEPDGVGVTILCPGPVATGMAKADRLRPASAGSSNATSLAAEPVMAVGMPPDDVGDLVIDGIRENATYVFTHPDFGAAFEPRFDEMRRALARTPKPRTGDVRPEDLS